MRSETRSRQSAHNGAGALAEVSREFRDFIKDIEDMVKNTTSLTGDELVRARAAINERITEARNAAEAMGEAITAQAREAAKATDAYVHQRPWRAIGVGAAVGLLAGVVIARRR